VKLRPRWVLFIAVAAVVLAGAAWALQLFLEHRSPTWPSAISLTSTLVLIAITAFYAIRTSTLAAATRAMADETRNLVAEAKAGRRPHLVATIDIMPPQLAELQLVNAGASAALNVEARFSPEPNGDIRTWTNPVMTSGKSVNFDLLPDQSTQMSDFVKEYTHVRVTAIYEDATRERYELETTLPVASMWDHITKAGQLAAARCPEDRQIEALNKIAKKL
jgi:hypothetical protein